VSQAAAASRTNFGDKLCAKVGGSGRLSW